MARLMADAKAETMATEEHVNTKVAAASGAARKQGATAVDSTPPNNPMSLVVVEEDAPEHSRVSKTAKVPAPSLKVKAKFGDRDEESYSTEQAHASLVPEECATPPEASKKRAAPAGANTTTSEPAKKPKITDSRQRGRETQYLIHCEGTSVEERTREPASNIFDAALIEDDIRGLDKSECSAEDQNETRSVTPIIFLSKRSAEDKKETPSDTPTASGSKKSKRSADDENKTRTHSATATLGSSTVTASTFGSATAIPTVATAGTTTLAAATAAATTATGISTTTGATDSTKMHFFAVDFGAGPLGMNINARAWQLAHDSPVSKKLLKLPQLLANIQKGALTVVDKTITGGQAEAAKVCQVPGDQNVKRCSDNL